MRAGTVAICYNEERFIGPHLNHIPLGDKLVLVSSKPWHGEPDPPDATEQIVRGRGEHCIVHDWATEADQRNAGQDFYADFDWVLHLDPDEFLLAADWQVLLRELEHAEGDAYTIERQYTYWRSGYVVRPAEPYRQLVAVRPSVKFGTCRDTDVGAWWQLPSLPVELHHFSWARTDAEVRSKLSHFGHAKELPPDWYERVWLPWKPESQDLHPAVPHTLKQAFPCELPEELADLDLWP